MKNVFFTVAFMLIGSFAFANIASVQPDTSNDKIFSNTSDRNNFKVSYNLGDISNLSEQEFLNLFDDLQFISVFDEKLFDECSISYTVTLSIAGQSVSVTATGTAQTCEKAEKIARDGATLAASRVKKMILELTQI